MTTLRLLLLGGTALAALIPATGRPWAALPLTAVALGALGELWLRALPGAPGPSPFPAVRAGLAALTGLVTVPLIALLLHASGLPVRAVALVLGAAVLTVLLGVFVLVRERVTVLPLPGAPVGLPAQRRPHPVDRPASTAPDRRILPGPVRTGLAVTLPVVLALGVAVVALRALRTGPRPAEPGYLSVALKGWASRVGHPLIVPAGGLRVPVLVTSAGLPVTTAMVRLRVGGVVVAAQPVTFGADTVRTLDIRVPELPADGCLRPVSVSVGTSSAGFYAATRPGVRVQRRIAC
ncbi:hypothetical protein [Actinoplanes rectilineatus]|uniref:hypothetical protein n=1 Tax=Actinoplanes rectilineatus TaxID=113571 RepID=UPI0005F2AFB0|nr:hypothetical protein [Actinoplanes rectilineatus]